jgi:hypothetical protein
MKRDQLNQEMLLALLEMIATDGSTGPGKNPPPEHVQALLSSRNRKEVRDVTVAHKNGKKPPDKGRGNNPNE